MYFPFFLILIFFLFLIYFRGLNHIPKKSQIVPFLAEMLQTNEVKQKFLGRNIHQQIGYHQSSFDNQKQKNHFVPYDEKSKKICRNVKYLRRIGSSICPLIRRSQKDLQRYRLFSFFTLSTSTHTLTFLSFSSLINFLSLFVLFHLFNTLVDLHSSSFHSLSADCDF